MSQILATTDPDDTDPAFSPLETARQILATTDLTDPDDIADAIYEATPKTAIPAAYHLMLRSVARDAIRLSRMGDHPNNDAEPRRVPATSSKVTAIRAWYTTENRQRVYANGTWQMLGDCTHADILDLAVQRRTSADRNNAQAERFEKLAAEMAEKGAATVSDLTRAAK